MSYLINQLKMEAPLSISSQHIEVPFGSTRAHLFAKTLSTAYLQLEVHEILELSLFSSPPSQLFNLLRFLAVFSILFL